MIPNPSFNVTVTDPATGAAVYFGGSAGVYLDNSPPYIGVWGGTFNSPFSAFLYGQTYAISGDPSLSNTAKFWYLSTDQYIFVIDNS